MSSKEAALKALDSENLMESVPSLARLLEQDPDLLTADQKWHKRISELCRDPNPRNRWSAQVLLCTTARVSSRDVVSQNFGRWVSDSVEGLKTNKDNSSISQLLRSVSSLSIAAILSRSSQAPSGSDTTRKEVIPLLSSLLSSSGNNQICYKSAIAGLLEIVQSNPTLIRPHSSSILKSLSSLFDCPDISLAQQAGICAGSISVLCSSSPIVVSASQFISSAIGSFHKLLSFVYQKRESKTSTSIPSWRTNVESNELHFLNSNQKLHQPNDDRKLISYANALCSSICSAMCNSTTIIQQPQQIVGIPLLQFPSEQFLDLITRILSVTVDSSFHMTTTAEGMLPLNVFVSIIPTLHILALKLLSSFIVLHGKLCLPKAKMIGDILCSELFTCLQAQHPTKTNELKETLFHCISITTRICGGGVSKLISERILPFIISELRSPFESEISERSLMISKPTKRRKQEQQQTNSSPTMIKNRPGKNNLFESNYFISELEALESAISTSLELLSSELQTSVVNLVSILQDKQNQINGKSKGLICRCSALLSTSPVYVCCSSMTKSIESVCSVSQSDNLALRESIFAINTFDSTIHPRAIPIPSCDPPTTMIEKQEEKEKPTPKQKTTANSSLQQVTSFTAISQAINQSKSATAATTSTTTTTTTIASPINSNLIIGTVQNDVEEKEKKKEKQKETEEITIKPIAPKQITSQQEKKEDETMPEIIDEVPDAENEDEDESN